MRATYNTTKRPTALHLNIDWIAHFALGIVGIVLGLTLYIAATLASELPSKSVHIEQTAEGEILSTHVEIWIADPFAVGCWKGRKACRAAIEEQCEVQGRPGSVRHYGLVWWDEDGEEMEGCTGSCPGEGASTSVSLTCSKKPPTKPEPVTGWRRSE